MGRPAKDKTKPTDKPEATESLEQMAPAKIRQLREKMMKRRDKKDEVAQAAYQTYLAARAEVDEIDTQAIILETLEDLPEANQDTRKAYAAGLSKHRGLKLDGEAVSKLVGWFTKADQNVKQSAIQLIEESEEAEDETDID